MRLRCGRAASMHLAVLLALLAVGTGSRAALGVAASSSTRAWTPATYPNPQKDLDACGRRGVPSRVCDPDGVLTLEGANMVEGAIQKIETGEEPYARMRCGELGLRGYQVAVAVMQKMDTKKQHGDAAAAAQAFAKQLHDSWGVGHAECHNGVLLLVSVSDRQIYISTGAGAKHALPQHVLAAVTDNMKPALRQQQYDDALLGGVVDIGLALAGQELPDHGDGSDEGWGIFSFFALLVGGVFGWGWWSSRKQQRRYLTCKQKLESIKAAQESIRRGAYVATSCPICLEDFDASGASAPTAAAAAAGAAAAAREGAAGASSSRGAEDATAVSAANEDEALLGGGGSGSSKEGSSKSGKGGAAEVKKLPRKPLVLHCGHTFCEPCISHWCEKQTTCPVCRKDIREGGDDDGNDGSSGGNPGSSDRCSGVDDGQGLGRRADLQRDMWLPEMGFRLRRLRLLYPDYVTTDMVRQWEDDVQQERALSTAAMRSFETRDPGRRSELEHAGRSGASTSFGGGSSFGGGGHGSSW